MKFITYDFKPITAATDEIVKWITEEYTIGPAFIEATKEAINDFFKPLKEDINVFMEFPYVDKVYRDSYYNYFSTKYRHYERDCVRLSFFERRASYNDIKNGGKEKLLNKYFLGYCVIRPTPPHVIGRNLVSKSAFIKDDFITCIHEENVLINGSKLNVQGFPHSSQDQETIACAETTLWAIMEYFGHKYAEYKPVLPSTILDQLDELSEKRMLPSNGLVNEQISFALKKFGFGTMIYSDENNSNFFPDLSAFIESGIPVITILEHSPTDTNHAILMVGREKLDASVLNKAFTKRGNNKDLIPFHSLISRYVVQDDNTTPYSLVTFDKPGSFWDEETQQDCIYKITTFVAPLYKKMYMDVKQARRFFEVIFRDEFYGSGSKEKCIFRMYMASSRSFKAHIANQLDLDTELRKTLLRVSFPRFIWCAEFINKADAARGTVSSIIVLDATERDENWKNSFIFAAHKNESIFYVAVDHTYKIRKTYEPFEGFKMYEHNLN